MVIRRLRRYAKRKYFAPRISGLTGRNESELLDALKKKNSIRRGYNKVFVIGYNKTGTTTLENVLVDLGFRLPDQRLQEELTSHVLVSGRYDILQRFVSRYDAFQDLPFSQENIYVALDALFPKSKFILSIRDPEAWYASLIRFHRKVYDLDDQRGDWKQHFQNRALNIHKNYSYEQARRKVSVCEDQALEEKWHLLYDQQFRVDIFTRRNNEIKRYFRERPSDLLVTDIATERDTSRICHFLEFDESKIREMPKLNQT